MCQSVECEIKLRIVSVAMTGKIMKTDCFKPYVYYKNSNGQILNWPILNGLILNGSILNGPVLNGPELNWPVLNGPILNGQVALWQC